MTDHLPECFLSEPCHPSLPEHDDLRGELSKCRTCGLPCICDRLRACEQRVLGLRIDDLNVKSFNAGYAAALRDAVKAVKLSCSADIELVERTEVIAVIEALKEKS